MNSGITDIHRPLVEACVNGSNKAQYKLYKLYSRAMFNLCYRMMNNREEAEDMLQEAFTEAFLKLDTFKYESTFGAWLKRIVINKCLNKLRIKKVEMVSPENLPLAPPQEEGDKTDFSEDVKQVYRAIEKLPDGYRIVLTLYLLEGYDHKEIAGIMKISESTSKSQYSRAKTKLKQLINQN